MTLQVIFFFISCVFWVIARGTTYRSRRWSNFCTFLSIDAVARRESLPLIGQRWFLHVTGDGGYKWRAEQVQHEPEPKQKDGGREELGENKFCSSLTLKSCTDAESLVNKCVIFFLKERKYKIYLC